MTAAVVVVGLVYLALAASVPVTGLEGVLVLAVLTTLTVVVIRHRGRERPGSKRND